MVHAGGYAQIGLLRKSNHNGGHWLHNKGERGVAASLICSPSRSTAGARFLLILDNCTTPRLRSFSTLLCTRGDVMRALLICGLLLLSGAATAQDRNSCFKNCDATYFACRHQCPLDVPESTPCAQQCIQQINECKKHCNLRYPRPLFPPSKQ